MSSDPSSTSGSGTVGAEAAGAVPASGREAGLWSDAWRQLRRNPLFIVSAGLIVLLTVVALFPGLFTTQSPRACDLANSLRPPSAGHWFGHDLQGCDYYTLVIYGARVSMTIGIVVVAASVVVAVVLGSLAGYYGGVLDTLIARVTDVWFAVPFILGAIVILTVLQNRGLFQVSLVLIALGWPTMLRLMRSSVLSAKEMDYVQAAQALGASDLRVLRRHILPNAIAPVIVYATIYVGIVIATEATLSFLGVGLELPAISWGLMINVSQTYILSAPHTLFFPALFLSVAVFSFILMGDALRDALDPKLR